MQGPPINNDPIPDGLLYTCRFDVLGGALPGVYPLISSNEIAQDPDAMPVGPVAGDRRPGDRRAGRPDLHAEPDADDHRNAVADADRDADRHADLRRRPTRRPTRRRSRPTNTPTDTPTPTPTEPPPVLAISAVVSRDPIGAGQLLTYTFLFSNAGGLATDITVTADDAAGHDLRVGQPGRDQRARASAAPARSPGTSPSCRRAAAAW